MSSFQNTVSDFATLQAEAIEAQKNGDGSDIPLKDGMYVAQIISGEADQFGDKDVVVFKGIVIDGDKNGTVVRYVHFLSNKWGIIAIREDLNRLGIDFDEVQTNSPGDYAELFNGLGEALTTCRIRLETKKGYQRVKIVGLVSVDDAKLIDRDELLSVGD